MSVLWDNSEIRTQLAQPQTIRVRHPYRGPRESYRTNLEISQITYDITKLYARVNSDVDIMDAHRMLLIDGGTIASNILTVAATPTAIVLDGLDDLITRVARLKDRVESLEV